MPFKEVKFSFYFMRSISVKYHKFLIESSPDRDLLLVVNDCERAVRACLKV